MPARKKRSDSHRRASPRESTIARTGAAIIGIGGGTLLIIAGISALADDVRKGTVGILVGLAGVGLGILMAYARRWTHVELDAREREAVFDHHDRDSDPEF